MIRKRRFAALSVVLAMGFASGCASLPSSSRTAAVHDVKIESGLIPEQLVVQPGDEIRWVNRRTTETLLEIPGLDSGHLSCQREFKNWVGSLQESIVLKTGESASLCFKKPTVVKYNARVETGVVGANRKILPGVITVGASLSQ